MQYLYNQLNKPCTYILDAILAIQRMRSEILSIEQNSI